MSELGISRELVAARAHRPAPVLPDDEPTLAKYVWIAIQEWRTIAAILIAVVTTGGLYVMVATPIYHVNAVVQVEPKSKGLAGLEDLLSQGPAETEIAIIRSRSSLNDVVDQLGLDISVSPVRLPLVGGAVARRYQGRGPAPAPLPFLARYAWGGDRLKIRRLDVPDHLLDIPLLVTVMGPGQYRVSDPAEYVVFDGEVGKIAGADVGERRLEIVVTDLVARPGTRFTVTKRRRSDLVAGLQSGLHVAEDGRLSGILVISLDGTDPGKTAAIVNAIATNYQRQNVDRKSAEASQQLAFLESQLPIVKKNVSDAETAYNKFLGTHGSVNLSSEAQSSIERSAEVERELTSLELQRSELRQRFTENHPALTSLNEKLAMLRSERANIGSRMRQMPEAEANSARLQNDLRVATELYNVLLNKAQELRVVKSGTVGNVRILDPAIVPHRPAWPKPGTIIALSTLLGLMAGIGGAFVRRALSQGVSDADEVEARTGLPVYAAIPHSDLEEKLIRRRSRSIRSGQPAVLAVEDPQDAAVEHMRSLRTSLQFALVESRNNIVSVSGPSPVIGKSFVCTNLAYVLASAERRVLLIDADLRRGRLHHQFGVERKPGLSDALSGNTPISAAVRRTENPFVDLLPTGTIPPNAAELLASQRFQGLLEAVSRSYSYVIVDTPPVLAVTDAAIVARYAGVNLLVLKSGQHSMREIALAVKRFRQGGGVVHGAVLNDVRATAGRYGDGRYQRYDYRSDEE